jgi:hypothetical protein
MIKLIDILREINEGKQVGFLYHTMTTEKFRSVLHSDILLKPTSFSRNKNYDSVVGRDQSYTYQIKIDGDKLSNNYKIEPVYDGKGWVYDEYEERVDKTIKNIGKYILDIIIINKKFYNWKNKGFKKGTYNIYAGYGNKYIELSEDIEEYINKYPHIKLKVKDGHGGNILDVEEKELKWLRSMGLQNPKEKEIKEFEGIYKDKKLLQKGFSSKIAHDLIMKNQDSFFISDYDEYEESTGEKIPISKIDQNYPFWDYFLQDPVYFLTNEDNNCVIIKQIRDKNNSIVIQILHNKNTKKDIPFYEELIKHLNKKIINIDIPKFTTDYYNNLDNDKTN